jgi:hypothetical protein
MMSEDHTIPVIVPCDNNQGTEERLLRTQYLWATVTTKEDREEWFSPNTSHVRDRAGYGQSTWYCRRSRLDSILVYCTANKV